jgi:ribose transport system permease protein
MTNADLALTLRRLRYRWSFRIFLSELLSKTWMEPAIPFMIMVALIGYFSATVPYYATVDNYLELPREFAEFGFVAIAMGLVIISGGIDLSVGAIFGIVNIVALILLNIVGVPLWLVVAGAIVCGGMLGALNGYLVGYLKARPFLTTMVTLIIYRAVIEILNKEYSVKLATAFVDNENWDFLGEGSVLGIPVNAAVLLVVMLVGHVLLSRSRPGWHITAIGSSRKAARHSGIKVERVLFSTYVISGVLCGIGGLFYAARQNSAGTDTGFGWEVTALTAVVLGGISLAGGKGTIGRALIGAVIVFVLVNGLVRLGVQGSVASVGLGLLLLMAVGLDVKWAKNRAKAIQKIYVNPTLVEFGPMPEITRDSGSPLAENDILKSSEAIGLDQIQGPEDVILDRQGRLYGSTREGWIVRFTGENFDQRDVFARIGGRPLGMAMDRDENLIVCIGGMGLYGVRPDGKVYKLTDQTNRTWYKLNDDSRLRLADDLDIAPDGKIYFSEATIRYEMHSWHVDGVEGRGNGRLVCYDPATNTTRTVIKNLVFPNGICVTHDGKSVLVASTWLCKIYRYWIEGPKKGTFEIFSDNFPGYLDNINRASDGGYWVALVGIRYPAFDLAMRSPQFRYRMVKEIPVDEWIFPGVNNGCVIKLDAGGKPEASYWDPSGINHPTITSMREHKGYLYLGGLENNRIGRIKIDGTDETWTSWESYWGDKRRDI